MEPQDYVDLYNSVLELYSVFEMMSKGPRLQEVIGAELPG